MKETELIKLINKVVKVAELTHLQQQALHNARMEFTKKDSPEFYKEYKKQLKNLTNK